MKVHFQFDVFKQRSPGELALATGWIAAEGAAVTGLALLRPDGSAIRCQFPFHRGDAQIPAVAACGGLAGFALVVPASERVDPAALRFAVTLAGPDDAPAAYELVPAATLGAARVHPLTPAERLDEVPEPVEWDAGAVGAALESEHFIGLAGQRRLTLRLDLINKCNLRCVMCHYSNEDFARRPVQRISPEKFSNFFDPIAAIVSDVVLSCGDEPLMSPHFEAIVAGIAATAPAVRMIFCTNAMLLTEKIGRAVVESRVYLVAFSFDGISSATLHRIRVGSDYRRIVQNIVGLQRLRVTSGRHGPRFVFNFVMMASNIHEAPLFVEVAQRLGADYIDFRHVVPFELYDIEHEMLERCQPKFNHYRERIVAAARAARMEIYLPDPFPETGTHDPAGDPAADLSEFNTLMRELGENPADKVRGVPVAPPADRPQESSHLFCPRPFTEVMIRNQRDVYPCAWHTEKMGTLEGDSTLAEIFFGEKFQKLRLAMLDPHGAEGCRNCPIKANYLPTQRQEAADIASGNGG